MRDPTTLLLPAYSLGYPGSSYRFAATATSQSSLQSSSTNVEVNKDFSAVVLGARSRLHGTRAQLRKMMILRRVCTVWRQVSVTTWYEKKQMVLENKSDPACRRIARLIMPSVSAHRAGLR